MLGDLYVELPSHVEDHDIQMSSSQNTTVPTINSHKSHDLKHAPNSILMMTTVGTYLQEPKDIHDALERPQ